MADSPLPASLRLLAGAALLVAASAWAQLRTVPPDAVRGTMSHVQDMVVEIDGQREPLAPGAQIRDPSNLVVPPSAVPRGSLVKYRRDGDGRVREVWILTPQEAAQPDPR